MLEQTTGFTSIDAEQSLALQAQRPKQSEGNKGLIVIPLKKRAQNIKTTTLTCNEYKFWTVENGINGETCSNKKEDDTGKFFRN